MYLHQFIYQINRLLRRNKIQHAWGPAVYSVDEMQGTTHAVEPVGGGSVRRVHRVNLRACAGPIPEPRRGTVHQENLGNKHPAVHQEDISESESSDAEFVVVEEVMFPGLRQPSGGCCSRGDTKILEGGRCIELKLWKIFYSRS